tara:strand:+ start:14211 stop:14474 length:264 start_codon:yes stop_codon:yes gene_type:complete
MSFTKAQDLTDVGNLKSALGRVQTYRGTRDEARALGDWATARNTVQGRSAKNDVRLGINYMQEKLDGEFDQLAIDHCTGLETVLNSV